MKLAFQLAYKNLIGAGLRTWLNVGVLSFAYIVIVFYNGLLDGWNAQAKQDSIAWEYGAGHLRHAQYDPLDPFSLEEGHGSIQDLPLENLTPILIQQASIYPEGRMLPLVIKGIEPSQSTLELPTQVLAEESDDIPAILGTEMARTANLEVGDRVLLRWRDKNGTFDAQNIVVKAIFSTTLPTVDRGQIWLPIQRLWKMTGMENEATLLVANESFQPATYENWQFHSQKDLLTTITEIIAVKKQSGSIMYILLLGIALLAIFDTQVLSIFRRQQEIGTYIALGMTRRQVMGIFTVEGAMYSLFAVVTGVIFGTPLLAWAASAGIPSPASGQDMGVAIADRIYPEFGLMLILSTITLVVIAATIVSYLPARKITKMNPVDAIKGKLQ